MSVTELTQIAIRPMIMGAFWLIHLTDKVEHRVGSIDNHLSIYKIAACVRPDECYHLAASTCVSYTFDDEASVIASDFIATGEVVVLGVGHL